MLLHLRNLQCKSAATSFPYIINPFFKSRIVPRVILSSTKHYSDSSAINNQESNTKYKHKNDILHKIISKSRLLQKLNRHPKFANYFDEISETGTITTLTSFLILHEATAILPLFIIWWFMYGLDMPEHTELPGFLSSIMENCNAFIEKFVGKDKFVNLDRNKLIMTGTLSYMIVKLLYPVRILFSLWAAPYFGKWLLMPVKTLRKLIFKK
ncbi:hypothetical protein Kpol_193p2 [Vanderwaltozyma polyspora DSM 70294]|uniref:Uncharacterized protein n=1 Tax=Vanderwaltozyma polyspora (strain ATCC 22028 / DSM 70294 / BCRC 21397 / CBS 2163 / NBRC 10782 / NRRL Y-8283 / UCD 57-17) TaxID=436907 RepID=A7TTL9_VANPO|nr:uncharacterized protein Kpol_193p2 [Vanderwaltozyma polyspora DSM 70294]EDO14388.1 hypothetical protein Kpol_193p2 [Vanderwaltozyma polyspora DSM 70294]